LQSTSIRPNRPIALLTLHRRPAARGDSPPATGGDHLLAEHLLEAFLMQVDERQIRTEIGKSRGERDRDCLPRPSP
jgi:hypothetical protein